MVRDLDRSLDGFAFDFNRRKTNCVVVFDFATARFVPSATTTCSSASALCVPAFALVTNGQCQARPRPGSCAR